MSYICPVCGYAGLSEPAYDEYGCASFEICSCCGFEYGFDDESEGVSFEEYRENWINDGASWFSVKHRPKSWSLEKQLLNIGMILP